MKKQLFLIVSACVFCFYMQAQITLNQSNTDFTPGIVKPVKIDTTGFIFPVAGANQHWNYSNLVKKSVDPRTCLVPSNPNFPAATYTDTSLTAVFIPGWNYYYNSYNQNSSDGLKYLGYSVKTQRYGVTMTGNPKDSCIFPEQFWVHSTPLMILPFPVTMGTSWHNSYGSVLNFQLTITSFGLNKVPCQKKSTSIATDTVIGWGDMRVPTAQGASLAYDVIMVKRIIIETDSFFLAGNPAPTALLTAFGITQGQTITTNRYFFWRENARFTLLMVNSKENSVNKARDVYYDETAEFDPNYSVNEIARDADIFVYPNPASQILHIRSKSKPVEFFIYNSLGANVFSGISDNGSINLNALPKGLYFIKLKSKDQTGVTKFIRN